MRSICILAPHLMEEEMHEKILNEVGLIQPNKERLIKLREVISRTGLSRSTIYLSVSRNQFPKPIKISMRRVGWLETEIDHWITMRTNVTRHAINRRSAV